MTIRADVPICSLGTIGKLQMSDIQYLVIQEAERSEMLFVRLRKCSH